MAVRVAVIPVAGRGTRLLPLTQSLPKEMLPLGTMPVVQHVVRELEKAGVEQIVMVTSRDKTLIEDHFDHHQSIIDHLRRNGQESVLARVLADTPRTRIGFTRQAEPRGLGHAVLCADALVGDRPFFVALGDALIGLNQNAALCQRMVSVFEEYDPDGIVAFHTVPEASVVKYGIAEPGPIVDASSGVFTVKRLVEKPSVESAPSRYAIAARYLFKPSIFNHLKQTPVGRGNEIQLTDAIQRLITAGGSVLGVPLFAGEKRYDIGSIASYSEAFIEAALTDTEVGESLRQSTGTLLQQLTKSTDADHS